MLFVVSLQLSANPGLPPPPYLIWTLDVYVYVHVRMCDSAWLHGCVRLAVSQVAGLSANEALAQMAFSPKVRSSVVRHVLLRAINRADFYHGLTSDDLKVAEAFTGKGLTAPRIRHHGRGACGPC